MTSSESDKSSGRRVKVCIAGRVQGVGYRYSTIQKAISLGLSGWVRNLTNGDVEAVFQGEPETVDHMIEWCRKGPAFAKVRSVDVTDEDLLPGDRQPFEVRH